MRRTTRTVVAGLSLAVVAGCADPSSPPGPDPAAARTTTGSPSAFPNSASEIGLSWTDDSPNESGWEVHRSTTGAGGTYALQASLPANSTYHVDGGLAPLTEYCYRVRSFRLVSRRTSYDQFQAPACATTYGPPSTPRLLNSAPAPHGLVIVTWEYTSTTQRGARIERAATPEGPWENVARLEWSPVSYTDQGRAVEGLVCYRVIAFNQWGESGPSDVDCTAPPTPPALLRATVVDPRTIDVAWADASGVEDGYELQRSDAGAAWGTIATLSANATTHRDGGLVENTRYRYRVRATRDAGHSAFTAEAFATTATTPPTAVTSLDTRPLGSSSIDVWWSGTPTLADWVRVERSTDGATWVTVANVSAESWGAVVDADRVAEQQVCHRAIATNAAGDGPPSPVACTVPPAAPSNAGARALDDGTTEHFWTDNSAHEDGFALYLYTWWYDEWGSSYYNEYVVELPANTTSWVTGPNEYFYALWATKDGGSSDVLWTLDAQSSVLSAAPSARAGARARAIAATKPARTTPTTRTP